MLPVLAAVLKARVFTAASGGTSSSISGSSASKTTTTNNPAAAVVRDLIPNRLGGAENCPCIRRADFSHNISHFCSKNTDGEECHPGDYGFGNCSKWDQIYSRFDECSGPDQPEWCGTPFCYVDVNQCARDNNPSVYTSSLTYSYETCGYRDTWVATPKFLDVLTKKSFRIAFPLMEFNDQKFTMWADKNGVMQGSVVRFISDIVTSRGSRLVVQNISKASMAYSSSLYTACTNDIAVGELDFCIGDLWQTPGRRKLLAHTGSFSTPIFNDNFVLVTFAKTKSSILESSQQFFNLVTLDAWLALLGVMCMISVTMQFVESEFLLAIGGVAEAQAPDEDSGIHGRDAQDTIQSDTGRRDERKRTRRVFRHLRRQGEKLYMTLSGLLGGSSTHECHSVEGRILNLGFGLFILSFVTYFTGTIAAGLVVAKQGEVASLEDANNRRMTICSLSAIDPVLKIKFPTLLVHIMPTTPSLLDGMDQGLCEAALIGEDYYTDLVLSSAKHCNKVKINEVIFSIPIGIPIRAEYNAAMSYAISEGILNGNYEVERTKAMAERNTGACASQNTGLNTSQLTLQQITGPILLAVICSGIAVIISIVRKLEKKAENAVYKRHSHIDLGIQNSHVRNDLHKLFRHLSHVYQPSSKKGLRKAKSIRLIPSKDGGGDADAASDADAVRFESLQLTLEDDGGLYYDDQPDLR